MIVESLFKEMETFAKEYKVPIINENGRKVFIEIVQKYKPQRVLEIGTAIGYSALLTAYYGNEKVKITSLELDEERAKQAQTFIDKSIYKDNIHIILGDAGVNISNMTNKSKGDLAYTILDVATPISQEVAKNLKSINGVYRVRIVK